MDKFMTSRHAVDDGDLMLNHALGWAYQKDQSQIVSYDDEYYNKCVSYEGKAVAQKINAGRIAFVQKHFGDGLAVDVGIGSGEFIKNRPNTYGQDINPVAIEWLKRNDLWARYLSDFEALTFWDVIEHVPTPADYFGKVSDGAYLFTSLPIFEDLSQIRASKHYRPGEHLYYFTEPGFVCWMGMHGFQLLERQTFEMDAGRENIYSFAFECARS